MDALVSIGDEGRDKLRKATVSGKYALTRGSPNGVTRWNLFPSPLFFEQPAQHLVK